MQTDNILLLLTEIVNEAEMLSRLNCDDTGFHHRLKALEVKILYTHGLFQPLSLYLQRVEHLDGDMLPIWMNPIEAAYKHLCYSQLCLANLIIYTPCDIASYMIFAKHTKIVLSSYRFHLLMPEYMSRFNLSADILISIAQLHTLWTNLNGIVSDQSNIINMYNMGLITHYQIINHGYMIWGASLSDTGRMIYNSIKSGIYF